MKERPISNMPTTEFNSIIDAYIEKETKGMGELDAPLFYKALREIVETNDLTTDEMEIEGVIVDDQLVLRLPLDKESDLRIKDIEVFVGGRRLSVHVKKEPIDPHR